MGLFGLSRATLIRMAIVALWLGFWEVYGQELYKQKVGKWGVGESAFGYFMVMLVSYIIAWWVTRGMKD